ncbi:hypothetical protein EV667_1085 [Ancylobacter aquaticus]|uniref:Uncharacterized protein n=1 Tax=Ancylobacter aquaticus TaxID=100 RepID=A0A4R1IBB6_ANCAQ|nr:hypothetical protein EV667_1085 [Ancylobacter aquaticus]
MGGSQKEDIKIRLEREGVPQPVIDYVSKYSRVESLDAAVGLISILFAVLFFAALIVIGRRIENNTLPGVLEIAVQVNGLLYEYEFISPLIPGLFGALLISVALGMFATLSPASWQPTVFISGITKLRKNRFSRWLLRRMMARLAEETAPPRYVRRFVFMPAWFLAGAGVLFLAISVPVAMLEVRAFEVFAPEGYYVSPLLPWEAPRLHSWASAAYVETGCAVSSGKAGAGKHMIYDVTFDDGTVVRLPAATPIEGSWLDNMEVIRWKLRIAGVRFVPWTWLWNDPYHPRCLRALWDSLSPDDFVRMWWLLRVPD